MQLYAQHIRMASLFQTKILKAEEGFAKEPSLQKCKSFLQQVQ